MSKSVSLFFVVMLIMGNLVQVKDCFLYTKRNGNVLTVIRRDRDVCFLYRLCFEDQIGIITL